MKNLNFIFFIMILLFGCEKGKSTLQQTSYKTIQLNSRIKRQKETIKSLQGKLLRSVGALRKIRVKSESYQRNYLNLKNKCQLPSTRKSTGGVLQRQSWMQKKLQHCKRELKQASIMQKKYRSMYRYETRRTRRYDKIELRHCKRKLEQAKIMQNKYRNIYRRKRLHLNHTTRRLESVEIRMRKLRLKYTHQISKLRMEITKCKAQKRPTSNPSK